MRAPRVNTIDIFQGAAARLQDRIVLSDQSVVTQADVNNWSVKVYDQSSGKLIKTLVSGETDTTENFFDTLQTGNGWSRDATGYNFEYVIAGDDFKQEGGKQYRVEFDAATASESLRWVWIIRAQPWMGAR